MRKAAAILLAAVLSAAAFTVTVSAATTNSVDRLSYIPKGTVLWEQGVLGSLGLQGGKIDGTDLVMRVSNSVLVNGTIPIDLTNAKWSFANKEGSTPTVSTQTIGVTSGTSTAGADATNYDLNRGVFTTQWIPSPSISYDAHVSTYFRYGMMQSKAQDASWGTRDIMDVPYRLDITGDSSALLTILPGTADGWAATGYGPSGGFYTSVANGVLYEIRIPLVIVTATGSANVTVKVGYNIAGVSQTQLIVVQTVFSMTAIGGEVVVAKDVFAVNPVTFTEYLLGAANPAGDPLTGGGSVILTLPSGFHWFNTDTYNQKLGDDGFNVSVILVPGLVWNGNYLPNNYSACEVGFGGGASNESVRYDAASGKPLVSFANVVPLYVRDGAIDDAMLKISFFNFNKSAQITGSIIVKGLSFYCDNNVPAGTVASLYVNEDTSGVELSGVSTDQYEHTLGVWPTNFPVAARAAFSGDATLASLSVSSYELSPAFSPDVTEYALTVGSDVETVVISAEANNANAVVSGAGVKSLGVGESVFQVVVKAEDGTEKTYTVRVTREADAAPVFICGIKSMSVKIGKPAQIPFTYIGPGPLVITSSNQAVCGVDPGGSLMPLKAGIAVITIKAPGFPNYVFAVTVTA
ncbi:MAG: cadherin-like beta sandwich domain-containing protein [Firmicutes bacterium]|nr:cadherin-like beta sandwich domain-containing protein [Bacillota bacterium]